MYQEAEKSIPEYLPRFDNKLIEKIGSFDDILGDFLVEQITILENELGKQKAGIPIKVLSKLITDERTKRVLSTEDMNELHLELEISKSDLDICFKRFEAIRIIKISA
jgi:hypothetical protein